jgi:hypothetical protein
MVKRRKPRGSFAVSQLEILPLEKTIGNDLQRSSPSTNKQELHETPRPVSEDRSSDGKGTIMPQSVVPQAVRKETDVVSSLPLDIRLGDSTSTALHFQQPPEPSASGSLPKARRKRKRGQMNSVVSSMVRSGLIPLIDDSSEATFKEFENTVCKLLELHHPVPVEDVADYLCFVRDRVTSLKPECIIPHPPVITRAQYLKRNPAGIDFVSSIRMARTKILSVVRKAMYEAWQEAEQNNPTEAERLFNAELSVKLGNFSVYKYVRTLLSNLSSTVANTRQSILIMRILYAGVSEYYNIIHREKPFNLWGVKQTVSDSILLRLSDFGQNDRESAINNLRCQVSLNVEAFCTLIFHFISDSASHGKSKQSFHSAVSNNVEVITQTETLSDTGKSIQYFDFAKEADPLSSTGKKQSPLPFPFNAECSFTRFYNAYYEDKTDVSISLFTYAASRLIRQRCNERFQEFIKENQREIFCGQEKRDQVNEQSSRRENQARKTLFETYSSDEAMQANVVLQNLFKNG